MAILRGFPPSNTISPSIRIIEKDLSLILPAASVHRIGLVGFASKGPINIPTKISSRRELHRTFGYPHPQNSDPYLIYAAEQCLDITSEVIIVRVADTVASSDEQAETASVTVDAAGGLIRIIGSVDNADAWDGSDYIFATDRFFRWKLNGTLASKTLTVLAGTYSISELVDELNGQLTSVDGIEFYIADDGDSLALKSVFSFGSSAEIELISITDALYGGTDTPTGLGYDMTQASLTGSLTKYPNNSYQTDGNYDFTSLTGLNLQIVIDGTDNPDIDNIVQVIDLVDLEGSEVTNTDIIDAINSQALGFEAYADGDEVSLRTLHFGRDAKLLVKAASTVDAILGLTNTTNFGTSPSKITGETVSSVDITYTAGRVTGTASDGADISFTITADSPGIEGNGTQCVIATDARSGKFSIIVYSNGNEVEQWGNLTKDETSSLYVTTYLREVSDYIRVTDNTDIAVGPLDGTYDLTGGSDGIPAEADLQDALLIGNDVAMTGMYALSDPEQVDIDLMAVPGHPSTDVIVAMLDVCANMRQDCFAIVDPPYGLGVNEIIDWQNGTHPFNLTRFDSDFGALYWPWVKIRDTTNRVDVWVPPSGSVLATIARSDDLSAPWFAPAGLNRGVVPNISGVASKPTLEERDSMYADRNAVNPIVQPQEVSDYVIMGQKTLQRLPTALDRVNVRRMMLYVEKRIRREARKLLFEPHDAALRAQFVRIVSSILDEVKGQRGINAFRVQCDTELNTPDVIDRNELRARIGIQPTRAVEFIFIEFSIHRTGSFTENTNTF